MRVLERPVLLATLLFLFIVLPLGAIEGWYGRVDYSGDAIPYLDMARAVQGGQWKLAFNPLWGLGYPLLIAALKPLFAGTAGGEWAAVHVLNLIIFAAAYASFIFLLRSLGSTLHAPAEEPEIRSQQAVIVAGTALYLGGELCMDNVSRVGPDLLVTTLVVLALALVLRLLFEPKSGTAVALGAVLGFGYVLKTIFLPLSLVILLLASFALFRRRKPLAVLGFTIVTAALFAAPYIAGLSWALGRFTLGESGTLNYAWHVNRLDLMHWQGGPAQFGKPLHPTTQLLADPPIYSFAEPFHVSYAPFFNPPYFYEGYRHFFVAKLQARAIAANSLHLVQALRTLPIVYAVLLCLVLIFVLQRHRGVLGRRLQGYWPILLPALAGIALYLQVHLEGRYLPGFLLVLATVPLTLFLLHARQWPAYLAGLVVAVLWVGSILTLWTVNRATWADARHHTLYTDSQQWLLARFLVQHGLQPGDGVAYVGGPATHCTWAYVDRLRIVAELAADVYAPPDTGKNLFWNATPVERDRIMGLFRQAGAKLVVAPATQSPMPGWMLVPGTDVAVHGLGEASP